MDGPNAVHAHKEVPETVPIHSQVLVHGLRMGGKWMRGAARHLAVTHEQAQVHRQATQTQGSAPFT
jgi:hypothetical protein